MRTVLITAFAPFGGEQINPSWEAVRQLHERMVCGCKVVAKELPCAFGDALTALYAEMEALQPELVIAVGQAGGRAGRRAGGSRRFRGHGGWEGRWLQANSGSQPEWV